MLDMHVLTECNPYQCSPDFKSFNYTYMNVTFTCNSSDQLVQVNDKFVQCTDPERFCRSVTMHERYFTEDPFDPRYDQSGFIKYNETEPNTNNEKKNTKLTIIIISCVVSASIIIISVVMAIVICFKRRSKPESIIILKNDISQNTLIQ